MNALVVPLEHASGKPAAEVGGKAANLAQLTLHGFPVPEGVVLTTAAFERAFLARSVRSVLDASGPAAWGEDELELRFRGLSRVLHDATLPPDVEHALDAAFDRLSSPSSPLVARSSGTLEDSAMTSFSGMLTSVPGVTSRGELGRAVRDCWLSAYSPRAVLYMREHGIPHDDFAVAVLVQRMVVAELAGLAFGRDPANRYASAVVVEAIRGVGEDIVSGEATPERYVFSVEDSRVSAVPSGARSGAASVSAPVVLKDGEVARLAAWVLEAEALLGGAQDMEWARAGGRFYVLQSRPLVFSDCQDKLFPQIAEETVAIRGIGVSPSVGSGCVRVLDRPGEKSGGHGVRHGEVAVLARLTNDLAVRLRDAAAVVADEGGATSHGANILREFGIPCVISTGSATRVLSDGDLVTVDGFRGAVYRGDLSMRPVKVAESPPTDMDVYVSVLVPERATVVAQLADGVSSLRNDYFLLQSGVHPARMVRDGQSRVLEDTIARGIGRTAALFVGKPVWYKTMDAPTDEFRRLVGGDDEPIERNPLLGWRGIGRELEEPDVLELELRAVRRALEDGCTRVGVKLPFIRFVAEYRAVLSHVERLGMLPHEDVAVGVSIETPAAAALLEDFLDEGADFVSVGVSDLAMCVLALDRESHKVADLFDPAHPAVVEVLAGIAETARAGGVYSCVCGESARDPLLLPLLVRAGFDAIGVSPSYFAGVKQEISRIENRVA